MASVFYKIFLLLTFYSSLQMLCVQAFEFEVGDDKGWVIPSSKKNDEIYNQWASKHRFQVDDTVRFKYEKDSVLVVTDSEYNKCRSVHPIFFSNNGDSIYKLERPGLFYFISGVAGHCERGQKMIIKVLEPENTPPPGNQNGTSDTPGSNGAVATMAGISSLVVLQLVLSSLGFFYA